MALVVEIPPPHGLAYRHAVDLVLRRALSLDVRVVDGTGPDYRLSFGGASNAIIVPDVFLRNALGHWLSPATLPVVTHATWDPRALFPGDATTLGPLPRIFAREPREEASTRIMPLDVFGAAFFFATRYEEAVRAERDTHDRMPCSASLGKKLGLLDRPVVHEYAELLLRALRRLEVGLEPATREFRVLPSHDIDSAYRWLDMPRRRILRSFAGELRRRSPRKAVRAFQQWRRVRRGDLAADPHATYDDIMTTSEERGLRSTFFFVADGSTGYEIGDPRLRRVLAEIHRRGHEIGLHAAYETYRDADRTQRERDLLVAACGAAGVKQDTWPNRQHVLRWDPLQTPAHLSRLGFSYDATLGFAEHVGFRTGLCVDHPAFDLATRTPLPLVHRPLVVMDATLTEPRYMGLAKDPGAVSRAIARSKGAAKAHRGDFGVLWHNSRLETPTDWDLYRAVLDA